MSVFKSQYSRSLRVIPSNNSNVPYPAPNSSGTNTNAIIASLVDSAALFVTNNVKTGDIVYNTTDNTAATVLVVVSETELLLNADIFTSTAKSYVVYQASAQTTIGNQGCYLYIGQGGDVAVTTIGGDDVIFNGLQSGTVLPVQVLKVKSSASGTTALLINALW